MKNNAGGILLHFTGNCIPPCHLTYHFCSVCFVSLCRNLVNNAVIPQQQGNMAAFPVIIRRAIKHSLHRPIPGHQLLGGAARDWSVKTLMELTDHISQQPNEASQPSRTGPSWWPWAQRPTIKTRACCAAGSAVSREEPSLHKPLLEREAGFKLWLWGFQKKVSTTETVPRTVLKLNMKDGSGTQDKGVVTHYSLYHISRTRVS